MLFRCGVNDVNILFLDNEQSWLDSFMRIFSSLHFVHIHTAISIEDAELQMSVVPSLDLIFLDFELDDRNIGTDLIPKIRSSEQHKHAGIFVFSAHDYEDAHHNPYNGVNFVHKDVGRKELRALIVGRILEKKPMLRPQLRHFLARTY